MSGRTVASLTNLSRLRREGGVLAWFDLPRSLPSR